MGLEAIFDCRFWLPEARHYMEALFSMFASRMAFPTLPLTVSPLLLIALRFELWSNEGKEAKEVAAKLGLCGIIAPPLQKF